MKLVGNIPIEKVNNFDLEATVIYLTVVTVQGNYGGQRTYVYMGVPPVP